MFIIVHKNFPWRNAFEFRHLQCTLHHGASKGRGSQAPVRACVHIKQACLFHLKAGWPYPRYMPEE